jgi:glycosyltransferase involved in cell wall biosynthesis
MSAAVTKKPVLMVGNFLSATHGVRGVCEELAARLPPLGWPVLTTSSEPRKAARVADMLRTAWRERGAYAVAQVDVYSGAAFVWAEAVCWTLRRAGKPYVLTLHGGNLPAFARRWPGRVRRLLASAEAVTAPSAYLREQLRPFRRDIKLQPNPLDIGRYEFRLRAAPQPRLVWLRAFHRMYNPALAPAVVARLAPEFPELTLTLTGPDKGDGSLQNVREVAERLGVADRVTFAGAVEKRGVGGRLNGGDIFLNTTNVDNTPVSVLEAMACGLCVVSTNVGGLPYLLRDGEDALLVPRNDVGAMAAAVRRVLTEPGLGARLSSRARRKAEECDWGNVLPQWDELLTRVVSREGKSEVGSRKGES